jgi:superfamily II helicase
MKLVKLRSMNDESSEIGQSQQEHHQRCELCNVPIHNSPCRDLRSRDVFKGKGKMLCNKCAATIAKMPAEQALQALRNASETYPRK